MSFRHLSMPAMCLALSCFGSSAHGGNCTDVSANMTLEPTATLMNLDGTVVTDNSGNAVTVASAIVGDSGGNTYSASIKTCRTNDAIINLLVGKRQFTAILPAPIASSGANSFTPPPGNYTRNGVVNVRNVICNGCSAPGQPFVTRVGTEIDSMVDRSTYHVWYMPSTDVSSLPLAPDSDGDSDAISVSNSPNLSSLAIVLPQPYNCTQGVYPSWIVRGTLQNQTSQPSYLQVGALVDVGKNGTSLQPAGQFSMPFEIRVQALSCFHPY